MNLTSIIRWVSGLVLSVLVFFIAFGVPVAILGRAVHDHHGHVVSFSVGFIYVTTLAVGAVAAAYAGSAIVSVSERQMMRTALLCLFVIFTIISLLSDSFAGKLNAEDFADVGGTALGAFWIWKFLLKPGSPGGPTRGGVGVKTPTFRSMSVRR